MEIKGEWFLPTSEDHRVYGTLLFHPSEGTDLEIYGSLELEFAPFQFKDQKIILGLSSENQLITLNGCLMTKSGGVKWTRGQESCKQTFKYRVRFILIGIHVKSEEALMFDTISSSIFNLDKWLGISGFKRNKEISKDKICFEYQTPEPIKFEIDDSAKGTLYSLLKRPIQDWYKKRIEIEQSVEFEVQVSEHLSINHLLKYLFRFRDFLILAFYKSTYLQKVTLKGESFQSEYAPGKKIRKKVDLYFSMYYFNENEKPMFDMEFIFNYKAIVENFGKIIHNWYSEYAKLEPAIHLLFEQFNTRDQFNINTFLNLTKAAETFHARINQSSNEKLYDRLSTLLERYSNDLLDTIIPDKVQFAEQVKDSRNYYTHYSENKKEKALDGVNLFYLSEKLKLLLVCAFLMNIGFKKEQLEELPEIVKFRLCNHLLDK